MSFHIGYVAGPISACLNTKSQYPDMFTKYHISVNYQLYLVTTLCL